MLASRLGPRSTASSDGWITSVAWRAVSDHFRRGVSERKWIDRSWIAPDPDAEDFVDLPATTAAPDDEVLLSDWLARAVAGDVRDAETLEMLLYKARLDATYDQVAADHGLSSAALRSRVTAFKEKYEAKWRRDRAVLALLLLLSALAVAAAAWVWLRSGRGAEETVPAPTVPAMPTAHPSATASAEDTPFEPALPPERTVSPPTPTGPPPPTPTPRRPEAPQRYNKFGKPVP